MFFELSIESAHSIIISKQKVNVDSFGSLLVRWNRPAAVLKFSNRKFFGGPSLKRIALWQVLSYARGEFTNASWAFFPVKHSS